LKKKQKRERGCGKDVQRIIRRERAGERKRSMLLLKEKKKRGMNE